MNDNHSKGGGQSIDDRTLLDPLDADELKALREARQKLQARPGSDGRAGGVIGPDAGDDDIGNAPTRAMMAIPPFESQASRRGGKANFMAEPKPLSSGKLPAQDTGSGLDASTQAATSGAGRSASNPAPAGGFGEHTLMWMEPIKIPKPEVIPERGAAAAAGMTLTQMPTQSAGRKAMSYAVVGLAILVAALGAVMFLGGGGEPSVVEITTNPAKAIVLIDGKETSVQTPMKASLPPGTHSIEIQLQGYRSERFDLTIVEGAKPTRQNFDLFPASKPGLMTVSVEVEPVAANITIDGQIYAARRTVRAPDLDPKTPHKIEVAAGGYETWTVETQPGDLKELYKAALKRASEQE